ILSLLYFKFNKRNIIMPKGRLDVQILEGKELKDQDIVGQNDAYVELYVDKKYKQRTTTKKDTNNPSWNESFSLYVYNCLL
ncbi:unnamed protein product, partial [Didymodactylos carnosus]